MPPVVPPHYTQAKRRMRWGLDPRVESFSTGRALSHTSQGAPAASTKQNTGQEHIVPMPGMPGGPVIPLGGGVNQMPRGGAWGRGIGVGANPRSGQAYDSYMLGNREYHNYGRGNVVSFERKPSPEVEARKQAAQAALLTQLAAMRQQVAGRQARATVTPQGGAGAILANLIGPSVGQQRRRRTLARAY